MGEPVVQQPVGFLGVIVLTEVSLIFIQVVTVWNNYLKCNGSSL
jgi:hypothetical protein